MTKISKFSLLTILCVWGLFACGNKTDYDYDYDTTPTYEESNNVEENATEAQPVDVESIPELKDYKGLYKVIDENGESFDIYKTKGESAIITTSKGMVYYCKWSDYSSIGNGIWIQPSEGEIEMTFKGGKETINNYKFLVLKDNYLYASTDYADSNNPNWRLPVTVEKAASTKGSSKSTSQAISDDDSGSKTSKSKSKSKDIDEEELRNLETIMYGYNEAAWRAKRRADQRR